MKVVGKEIDSLELDKAVEACLKYGVEHFPPLASDECLSNAVKAVASQVRSRIKHNYPLAVEIIAYPRKLFGVRPVAVMSLGGRALYRAIVDKIRPSLPEPSRGSGKWQMHREFGLQSDSSHIVEFDIASCYEYVDHDLLLEDLVLRTDEADLSMTLTTLLREVQGRGLGLPQLSHESDLLADTYLDILTRRLMRQPYKTSRFVDDFRVLATSFEEASLIIERSSEIARELGLVLSTEKTKIFNRRTLVDKYYTDESVLGRYFTDAQEAMERAKQLVSSDYESEDDEDENDEDFDLEPSEFDVYRSILDDWLESANPFESKEQLRERLSGLMPKVISVLRYDDVAIDQNRLRVLATNGATLFESVIEYVVGRIRDGRLEVGDPWDKSESHWELLANLCKGRRQTPWMKLWLIYASRIHPSELLSTDEVFVMKWLTEQLEDRHELIRGEAAWVLAEAGSSAVNIELLLGLYQRATELTRPLLAACLARLEGEVKGVVSAVQKDGPLMKEAVKWAIGSGATS